MAEEQRDSGEYTEPPAEVGSVKAMFVNLPRRIKLTIEYEGFSGFLRKSFRFVVRLTPLRSLLSSNAATRELHARARAWYRKNGRHVTVIIPAYGDPAPTLRAVESVRKTTRSARRKGRIDVRVVDDGSPPEALAVLQRELGDSLVAGGENAGFARNVNRALEPLARNPNGDAVLLNNDVIAHRSWLESLQYAAYHLAHLGIVGAKLLYPDGTIQFAGSHRNNGAPDWFDHRFRFKPADFGPANVPGPALAVTGACMYIKETALRALGPLDPSYGMAFEDVDYCLRAWDAGFGVHYYPPAVLTHAESKSRGRVQGERELESKELFWSKWGDWFDGRDVSTPDGKLRITYTTQDTGVGGGHRVIFEQMHRLSERGHDVSLYTLGGPPSWYDLQVPVHSFDDYDELIEALSEVDAIKVATWWETAEPVWLASVRRGIPVYLVQDIETSYYPGSEQRQAQNAVLASYRPEFRYLTTSPWNVDRLAELGHPSTLISCGVDRETFRPLGSERRDDVLLAVGRSHHLKNLELTVDAWRAMPEPRPELWLYGIEPELAEKYGVRYIEKPSDAEVNELYNQATVFVQTSRHEGFCLPLLEAMSAGTPTVCTDAHGNRGFCRDGVNTLIAEPSAAAVGAALTKLFADAGLREKFRVEGLRTAEELDWRDRGEPLERFFRSEVLGHVRRRPDERPVADRQQAEEDSDRDQDQRTAPYRLGR